MPNVLYSALCKNGKQDSVVLPEGLGGRITQKGANLQVFLLNLRTPSFKQLSSQASLLPKLSTHSLYNKPVAATAAESSLQPKVSYVHGLNPILP